ncbi:hypothetical protein L13192_04032 [Pyrenophora tritici-repentis]|nr:hypothetical protein L13192_04032 [Pyrenophora tritici-repentis]KAI1676996.1 hypothetical protein KJE20_13085 [Pyrenophora tritici-repentis]
MKKSKSTQDPAKEVKRDEDSSLRENVTAYIRSAPSSSISSPQTDDFPQTSYMNGPGDDLKSGLENRIIAKKGPLDTARGAKRPFTFPPHTRTSIGQLTYKMSSLPAFYIKRVGTGTETASVMNPIMSRRVRHNALKLMLEDIVTSKVIRDSIVIDTRGGPYEDFLIMPFYISEIAEVKRELGEGVISVFKTMTRVHEGIKGIEPQKEYIYCSLFEGIKCSDKTMPDLYWKTIRYFLRARATNPKQPCSLYDADAEFFPSLPQASSYKPIRLLANGPENDTTSPKTDLRIRFSPSFHPISKKLELKFDIVPWAKKQRLDQLFFNIFGELAKDVKLTIHNLRAPLNIFRGLVVRRIYPPGRNPPFSGPGSEDEFERPENGCSFRICNLCPPHRVPNVNKNVQDYTVYEYFNKFILDGKSEICHPELPLARDQRGDFYPLEMLELDHDTALPGHDDINRVLQARICGENFDWALTENTIKKTGDEFIERAAKSTDETRPPLFDYNLLDHANVHRMKLCFV